MNVLNSLGLIYFMKSVSKLVKQNLLRKTEKNIYTHVNGLCIGKVHLFNFYGIN